MAKIGRNQPCPCGSGRKHKHCCWQRDGAAPEQKRQTESSHGYYFAETDLDRLSNSVVSLIDEGRLDEAAAACEQLRTQYPEVHDWLMRKAMVCEARGETELAIEYCERTIAWMDANPEGFDPESREPYYEDIERLRASLRGASERARSDPRRGTCVSTTQKEDGASCQPSTNGWWRWWPFR